MVSAVVLDRKKEELCRFQQTVFSVSLCNSYATLERLSVIP